MCGFMLFCASDSAFAGPVSLLMFQQMKQYLTDTGGGVPPKHMCVNCANPNKRGVGSK